MKVFLIRRDKSVEVHRARADNVVIDDVMYYYEPDAVLHLSRGIDKKAIVFVENRPKPVIFSNFEALTTEDKDMMKLITHDMAKVKAMDEFRDMKRADNTVIWVLVAVIAIMAVIQIISVVKI
jgi:methionine synthase II (cobalamin-independent)